MQKLKTIKKQLKNDNLWKSYKQKFKHKQMHLLFSKITLIFVPDANENWLIQQEKNLLNQEKNSLMFVETFNKINTLKLADYDWKSFGHFIWYVYQTSTFYHDQKHGKKNLFNEKNYVEKNAEKRHYYYAWLESISPTIFNYNNLIKQVLNKVF